MRNGYLWDGSGEPDPELQRLEKSLSQFRYSRQMPDFPVQDSLPSKVSFFPLLSRAWIPRFAAAAILFVALASSLFLLRISSPLAPTATAWDVARVSGAPRVGYISLTGDSTKAQLNVGQELVTDDTSRAAVALAEVGEIQVDPGSRLRLMETSPNRARLALERGTIHAAIWAPPGKFVVETPSATAVDLGCAYTLQVNDDGSGLLRTTVGWVGFHKDGHDSFIPAGAMCMTRRVQGPGTPFFEDAPAQLRSALHDLDFGPLDAREQALRLILAQARTRDAFTLWHLLFRANEHERPLIYDRLVSLVPPPARVTREGTLALDPAMMDAWWNAFDLGDISIWRFWEQTQAPPASQKVDR
jgi:hypothetical protein